MLLLSLILVPLFGTHNYTNLFQKFFKFLSKHAVALFLIFVTLLNNIICYNNSAYCSFITYNWDIICFVIKLVCLILNIINNIFCVYIYLIVLICTINLITIVFVLITPIIIKSCFKLIKMVLDNKEKIFKLSADFLRLLYSALVSIYYLSYYLSNQIITKRSKIYMSFGKHPVVIQRWVNWYVLLFIMSETLLSLILNLFIIDRALSLIPRINDNFLGINSINVIGSVGLILVLYISSWITITYYNGLLEKIDWKDKLDPIYCSCLHDPNIWPLYTIGALFISSLSGFLALYNFTGAWILMVVSLISLVCFMWLWLRHDAINIYSDTAVNIYCIIKEKAIGLIYLFLEGIYLFFVGSCVVIYEIFNKTLSIKEGGFFYRVYYSALYKGNIEQSVAVFVFVTLLIFRLGITWDNYYVFMNRERLSWNEGSTGGQPSGGNNGNGNGNGNTGNAYISANPEEDNRINTPSTSIAPSSNRPNSMALSIMLSDNTTSVFSSPNVAQNSSTSTRNILATNSLRVLFPSAIPNSPYSATTLVQPFTQFESPNKHTNLNMRDINLPVSGESFPPPVYPFPEIDQQYTHTRHWSISDNDKNIISNTHLSNVSGKLFYLSDSSNKKHYLFFRYDDLGNKIKLIKKYSLSFCKLELVPVKISNVDTLQLALNLDQANFRTGIFRGVKGVLIDNIFKSGDDVREWNNSRFTGFNSQGPITSKNDFPNYVFVPEGKKTIYIIRDSY